MNQEVINAELKKDIDYIKKNIDEIQLKLDEKYVTHAEFEPVKKIVYGMVAFILLSFIGAVASLIYINQ